MQTALQLLLTQLLPLNLQQLVPPPHQLDLQLQHPLLSLTMELDRLQLSIPQLQHNLQITLLLLLRLQLLIIRQLQ